MSSCPEISFLGTKKDIEKSIFKARKITKNYKKSLKIEFLGSNFYRS
jgi:hypothetical protein